METKNASTALSCALAVALLSMASERALAQSSDAAAQASPPAAQQATAASAAQAPDAVTAQAASNAVQAAPATGADAQDLDTVVVQGFRRSVQFSTDAKRDSVNVTDSIFAEDLGKFPDQNIAESLSRIPGVQLQRDVNGEGVNVAIRGLGNSFTKTTLNGGSIATASIGYNAQNQNREVDLNLLPTEFFTQLSVSKTPKASLLEGGVSGVVDLRTPRPFDKPGAHLSYQLNADYRTIDEKTTPRGSLLGSWTNADGTFGALIGVSSSRGKLAVRGFESIGWTNPGLTYQQCGLTPPAGTPVTNQPAECNRGGGGNWRIPDTVPNNASAIAAGLTPGQIIDRNLLLSLNPGLSIDQLSEALIPRLGRPVYMSGDRDRDSVVSSLEWRPSDQAHFYLDSVFSKAHRTNERIDVNLIGRNFAANGPIPVGAQVDGNGVVTSATLANAQFFLEARPYEEDVKFWNINPGAEFLFGKDDNIKLNLQANMSRSWMFRESPSIVFNSPFTTVEYRNQGGNFPTFDTPLNLNDPNIGWTWAGGRVNINNEKRLTRTKGARGDLQFGDDSNNLKVGFAYDEEERTIRGFDNSVAYENVVCRGLNPDGSVPNPRPPCSGGPLAAIPDAALASYLRPGPYGFVTVDFARFKRDTNYAALRDSAPISGSANTGATTGGFSDRNLGFYVETNGQVDLFDRSLRYNAGVRRVTTTQETSGPTQINGSAVFRSFDSKYTNWLPSFNLAWDVAKDVVVRLSGSRTLTRPNPSDMLPNTNFSDPVAQQASQGNPSLDPYVSTNIDFGGEWYTGQEGYVGFNYFNKDIKGFTVLGTRTIPFRELGVPFENLGDGQQGAINARGGPDAATVTVQQQVNADGTLTIRGWEINWVQPLDRVLDGLGFIATHTRIKQITDGQLKAVAVGVAPELWNATAYWENKLASVRLSYSWTDGAINSQPNQNGIPKARLRGISRGQLDLSAGYTLASLPSKPQITFNVTNITNEGQRSLFEYSNATYDYYEPGRTYSIGIRGTF